MKKFKKTFNSMKKFKVIENHSAEDSVSLVEQINQHTKYLIL
jgi:hypothetical protein